MVGAVGFNTYSSNLEDIIDVIADSLILSNPQKFEKINVGDNTDRVCVRLVEKNKYLMLKCSRVVGSFGEYTVNFEIGSEYDELNNNILIPDIFKGVVLKTYYANDTTYDNIFISRTYNHIVFIDEYGIFWNMFNPYNDFVQSSCGQSGFSLALEFIPTSAKEYNDGNSGICLHIDNYPAERLVVNRCGQIGGLITTVNNISPETVKAYKSLGNNKIYFEFPRLHNNTTDFNDPIYQTRRFFYVDPLGLTVNDVISWIDVDGETVRKFIILLTGSGSGTSPVFWAMPFDNAYPYE